MILPDIWGQGALFSYSGADGEKLCKGAIDAQLCADCFGIRFLSENKCTLSITAPDIKDITFSAVMTDYIKAAIKQKDKETSVTLMFIAMDTVMIHADSQICVTPGFERDITVKKQKKCTLFTDGTESFALAQKNDGENWTYVFCYGKKASDRAAEEILKECKAEEVKKLSFYAALPEFRIPSEQIEKLYYRCASLLSGHLNSAEGIIKSDYLASATAEGKALHPFYSSVCTLGLRHILPGKAKDTLESVLASVAADGMLSSQVTPMQKSNEICPPVLAWCFWELYLVNGDKEMLENAYAPLKKYLHYIIETRDINKNHLFEWQISYDDGESGKESTMDNSPRFDDGVILDCVDFSAYMANESRYMIKIAEEIDKHGEALYWDVVFERIKNAVNEQLFDEDDKIYYDKAVVSNMFRRIKTSASFLPLFAQICDNRHAMAMLRLLNNEDKFNLKFGVPSVSRDSEEYSSDMYRGPMHIVMNYMIAKGLDAYEMHDKANEIKAKSLEAVMTEFEADGVLYEFYSADGTKRAGGLTKKGSSTNFALNLAAKNLRDYAPTAAIIIDMLLSKSKKMPANKQ